MWTFASLDKRWLFVWVLTLGNVCYLDAMAKSSCPSTASPSRFSCSDIKYASLWFPSRGYSDPTAAGVRIVLDLFSSGHTMHWELRKCWSCWSLPPHAPDAGSACCGLDLDLDFSRQLLRWPWLAPVSFLLISVLLFYPCFISMCPWVLGWVEHRDAGVSALTESW